MSKRFHNQHGFTIIELMVASTIGLLLMTGILSIMYQSAGMADVMRGQVVMNQQAREMFRILTDGGVGSNGPAIPGLRGHKASTAEAALQSVNYRLVLSEGTNVVRSGEISAHQVSCIAAGNPLADCTGTETITVNGHLGAPLTAANNNLKTTTFGDFSWAVVTVNLIDPIQASNRMAGAGDVTDSFYTIIGLNKEN